MQFMQPVKLSSGYFKGKDISTLTMVNMYKYLNIKWNNKFLHRFNWNFFLLFTSCLASRVLSDVNMNYSQSSFFCERDVYFKGKTRSILYKFLSNTDYTVPLLFTNWSFHSSLFVKANFCGYFSKNWKAARTIS